MLDWYDDPTAFLDAAAPLFAADPVATTVLATATRRAAQRSAPPEDLPYTPWWCLVRDTAGTPVGAAMRTMPSPPYAAYLLPMPAAAVDAVADVLLGRGEELVGVNGAAEPAQPLAKRLAQAVDARVEVAMHTRLFELGELVRPAPVPGRLRPATAADRATVAAWLDDFDVDADRQAGREPTHAGPALSDEQLDARLDEGLFAFWEDAGGRVVHLVGWNRPAFGVVRIGPVYTPAEQRGRGWASAAVAEVSGRLLADGLRACLFTDQANPTSNGVYQRLGYEQVHDEVQLLLRPGDAAVGTPT